HLPHPPPHTTTTPRTATPPPHPTPPPPPRAPAPAKATPSGRPPQAAVLDRHCARQPRQCAGRDGRMAPPGAEPKNATKPGGQHDVKPESLIPSSHLSTKPG